MKNKRFENMIKDLYLDQQKRKYITTIEGSKGYLPIYVGVIYCKQYAPTVFYEINDIDYFLDDTRCDMLLLSSGVNHEKLEIYEHKFKDYRIIDDKLYIYYWNGKEKEFNLGRRNPL